MNPVEIEAALQAAFKRCDADNCPLTDRQKEILMQIIAETTRYQGQNLEPLSLDQDISNPLDELNPEQRQSFLQFVREQEQHNRPWKIALLNDWLHDRDSGTVHFIRDRYGFQWLNRIKPVHFAKYTEWEQAEVIKLKVGDRIEVSNALWEWVQDTGPCSREWFPCLIVQVKETENDYSAANCIIRFNNGAEYEIQGVYAWNRYNWRWLEE